MAIRRKASTTATTSRRAAERTESDSTDEQFVVLLRHGIAEDPSGEKPDSERSLTSEGLQKMKKIGRGLAELIPDAEVVLSSPLLRCVQTSARVSKSYEKQLPVKTADELKPGASADDFLRLLARTTERRVIIVGHEPVLTNAMRALTGAGSEGGFELKKGGAYGVRRSKIGGSLEWMLPPRILRRLA